MDQVTSDADLEVEIPAISIQLATQIGGTRSLTLTTGIRLDSAPDQINRALDKIVAAADRQKKKFDLEQTRQLLKNEEQNLHLHRQQIAAQQTAFEMEFAKSGRRGDWEPKGSQKGILDGLNKNVSNSVDRIKQLRDSISEMEKECR